MSFQLIKFIPEPAVLAVLTVATVTVPEPEPLEPLPPELLFPLPDEPPLFELPELFELFPELFPDPDEPPEQPERGFEPDFFF